MVVALPGRLRLWAACLLFVAGFAGCGVLELQSAWRDREIIIDGDASEWIGLTTRVEKGNLSVGVVNDDENIYLCLYTPNTEVAGQVVFGGLTLWLDPDGGIDRKLGIHCPIGARGPAGKDRDVADRREMEEMLAEMLSGAGQEVEILGPDNEVLDRYTAETLPGIEVALGYSDRLAYEIKIPLYESEEHPYALRVDWDQKVGIGFVTPEPGLGSAREGPGVGPGGGMPDLGEPPMGAAGPPGGPGRMRSAGRMPEPLDLWCRARLATDDAGAGIGSEQ
jgi:hypothetical protein